MDVPIETEAQILAYKFLDAYDECLNRDDFLRIIEEYVQDLKLREAIWEMIDLLVIGGK